MSAAIGAQRKNSFFKSWWHRPGRKSSNHFCVKQRLSRKHCKKDNWRYLYCKADSDPRVSRKNVVSSRWIIIPKRVEKVRESKYFISGLQFQHARNNSNFPKHTSSTWFTFFIIVIPLSSALTWTMKMQTSTIFYRKHELLFFSLFQRFLETEMLNCLILFCNSSKKKVLAIFYMNEMSEEEVIN